MADPLYRATRALALTCITALACDPSQPSTPGEQPVDARATKPNRADDGDRDPAVRGTTVRSLLVDPEAPPLPVDVEPAKLPEIAFAPASVDQQRRSRELARAALRRLEDEDAAAAAERLAEAVAVDPGNVLARYNLAGALEAARQHDLALAVLRQLADAGCPHCLGQLIVADQDEIWDAVRRRDEFRAVVHEARERLATLPDAGQVSARFTREGGEIPPFIDPRRPVSINVVAAGSEPVETLHRARTFGPDDFSRWVTSQRDRGLLAGALETCDERCCRFAEPTDAHRALTSLVLGEVCFRVADDRAISLRSVELVSERPDVIALDTGD